MQYDNGKAVDMWTTLDNKVLERIYKTPDLTDIQRRILLSLCRQIFKNEDNVIRTSWWAARKITAEDVGCSESSVNRAYKTFSERNIITRTQKRRPDGGNKCWWITMNTDTDKWQVS